MDRLEALLKHFTVSAQMFHSGALCGINDFEPQKGLGQLHLLQRGQLQIEHQRESIISVTEPSLLFYPRPYFHRFISDEKTGVELTCANIQFNGGVNNPLVQSLPAFLILPLSELDDAEVLLDILFREAFNQRCGRQVIVDRLFEVVLVNIFRVLCWREWRNRKLPAHWSRCTRNLRKVGRWKSWRKKPECRVAFTRQASNKHWLPRPANIWRNGVLVWPSKNCAQVSR